MSGTDLYLVDSISNDASFANPVQVPEGFVGNTLSVPRPPRSGFYLKLKDEPDSENMVVMPVQIQRAPQPPQPVAAPPATPSPAPSTEPPSTPVPDSHEPAPSGTAPDTTAPAATPPSTPQPVHKAR
jgi:hypothetical protein